MLGSVFELQEHSIDYTMMGLLSAAIAAPRQFSSHCVFNLT